MFLEFVTLFTRPLWQSRKGTYLGVPSLSLSLFLPHFQPLLRFSSRDLQRRSLLQASVVMQRLSYPTETVLSNKITTNRLVLSFKDSPRTPLGRRPFVPPRPTTSSRSLSEWKEHGGCSLARRRRQNGFARARRGRRCRYHRVEKAADGRERVLLDRPSEGSLRGWLDTHSAAIQCFLGLLRASPVGQGRLAPGKPMQNQMAALYLSGQPHRHWVYSRKKCPLSTFLVYSIQWWRVC